MRVTIDAHLVAARERGFDPDYGRRVPGELVRHGFADVQSDGRVHVWAGGSAGSAAIRLTIEQLREGMLQKGVPAATIDAAVALCDDHAFSFLSPATVAAWGRRPD